MCGGMTMTAMAAGTRATGQSMRTNGPSNNPRTRRWHDHVDNGRGYVDNGPQFAVKTKSLKDWANFNKRTLFRVCGLMTKTLTQLELSLYEGYGILLSRVLWLDT